MIQLGGENNFTLDYANTKIKFGNIWYYSGGSSDTTTFFGSIQSIRIYNRALTDAEIAQNFNNDKNRFNITITPPSVQLAGNQITTKHYGKLTNFQSKGVGNENLLWRIFYKDENNIYLISSKKENGIEKATLTSSLTETSSTISNLGKSLNPLYTATTGAWSMNLPSEQTVAFLLDSTNWDSYTDQAGNASWAVGGPPIEMFINSLEQTYPNLVDSVWVEPGYGYRYSGTIASTPCLEKSYKKGIYGADSLISYTLPSPCGAWGANNRICGVADEPTTGKGWFWNQENWKWAGNTPGYSTYGIRPIVCIPLNNFNYTIYNNQ